MGPPPLSVRVTFCSSKNLPRSSQEFEPRLFYLSPCQFPSSFYRAYTTLISSSNDNTLHIYDRSRDNQKTNNFPFFSFQSFFSSICGNVPHCFRTVHNTITTNFYI